MFEKVIRRMMRWEISRKSGSNKNKGEIKSKIKFYFDWRDIIDGYINNLSVEYYNGKHPKHFLWRYHYKFILDNVNENDMILDVGCGKSSSYIAELAKSGQIIDACDVDVKKVEWNKKKNRFENIDFFVMDIAKELPTKKYDVVILSHVLEHIEDPLQVLSRLKSITNKLIIRLPRYDDHWMYLVKKDLGLFYFKDCDHKREYILKEAIELIESAGWTIASAQNDIDIKIVARIFGKSCPSGD